MYTLQFIPYNELLCMYSVYTTGVLLPAWIIEELWNYSIQGWYYPILQIVLVQINTVAHGKEINQLHVPQAAATTFVFSSVKILLLPVNSAWARGWFCVKYPKILQAKIEEIMQFSLQTELLSKLNIKVLSWIHWLLNNTIQHILCIATHIT